MTEEFFRQGDQEATLGLPISPLMDRNNSSLPLSQINFIEFIVAPLYFKVHLPQRIGHLEASSIGLFFAGTPASTPRDGINLCQFLVPKETKTQLLQ